MLRKLDYLPRLPKAAAKVPASPECFHEVKYDGYPRSLDGMRTRRSSAEHGVALSGGDRRMRLGHHHVPGQTQPRGLAWATGNCYAVARQLDVDGADDAAWRFLSGDGTGVVQ